MSVTIMLSRYSGFPPEIFEKGLAAKMRDCSLRLYILLCRESDRMSSRRLSFLDSYANEQASISATSMRLARHQLKELGLVCSSRSPGGKYTYDLCDLRTGMPYPGDPRASLRRGQSKPVAQTSVLRAGATSKPKFLEPEFVGDDGEPHYDFHFGGEDATNFPFGANALKKRVA